MHMGMSRLALLSWLVLAAIGPWFGLLPWRGYGELAPQAVDARQHQGVYYSC